MTHLLPPPALAAELRALTALELSPAARFGYVALLLAASAMTAVVAALLATEPALLRHTAIALAVLTAIGLCWIGFAVWVLTGRRILLGRERLVAGRLALAFTSVFTGGALLTGYVIGSAAGYAAAAIGLGMVAAAAALWLRARGAFARLSERRAALERELGLTAR
jgi:hypothetical protein